MNLHYKPTTDTELFAARILTLLVEKYPQSFYVGGMVRDLLLNKKTFDIDIATEATPENIITLFETADFRLNTEYKQFGVIIISPAQDNSVQIEVTTFRNEKYSNSRYPKVSFITSVEEDALRRDFTINALYMGLNGAVLDFTGGLEDIAKREIRFIGEPKKRLTEDPVRLLRAIRFSLALSFNFETQTLQSLQENFSLIDTISNSLLQQEIKKLSSEKQIAMQKIINSKHLTNS